MNKLLSLMVIVNFIRFCFFLSLKGSDMCLFIASLVRIC